MRELSYLDMQLIDEYRRCKDSIRLKREFIENELVKGYISSKRIKGKAYSYLQWRDGDQIRSVYIKDSEVPRVEQLIQKRKELEKEIKLLEKNIENIEKILPREALVNE